MARLPTICTRSLEAIGLLKLLGLFICLNAYRGSDDGQCTQNNNKAASSGEEFVSAGHELNSAVGSFPYLFNVALERPLKPHPKGWFCKACYPPFGWA